MNFSRFLDEVILKKIGRSELIVKLHLAYEEFSGLDQITFTRWKNGTTTPSLLKQVLISLASDSLNEYFERRKRVKIPVNIRTKYLNYLRQFDNYYHAINNKSITSKLYYYKGKVSTAENIFIDYAVPISLKNNLLKNNDELDIELIYRARGSLEKASSFIMFSTRVDKMMELLSPKLQLKGSDSYNFNNSIFISTSYFSESKDFEELTGLFFNKMLWDNKKFEKIYFIIRGRESIGFYDSLGANEVAFLEASEKIGNIYLYSMDWKDVIGNPIILSLVHKTYHSFFEVGLGLLDNEEVDVELISDDHEYN